MGKPNSDPNIRMGRRLFVCHANPARQSARLTISGCCLAAAILVVGMSSGATFASPTMILGTAMVASILAGPIILVLMGQYLRLKLRQVVIYEEGISIILGLNSREFQWSDFSGLTIRRLRDSEIGVKLYVKRRQVLTINHNYQHAELLTKAVTVRTAEALISHYIEIYRIEGAVSIGRVRLSTAGIDYRGDHLPWQEVNAWQFKGDQLILFRHQGMLGFSIDLRAMQNAYLLPWLLESIALRPTAHADNHMRLRALPIPVDQ